MRPSIALCVLVVAVLAPCGPAVADLVEARARAAENDWRGVLRSLDDEDRSSEAARLLARAQNELGREAALESGLRAVDLAATDVERALAEAEVAVALARQRPVDGPRFARVAAALREGLSIPQLGWTAVRIRWCDARAELPARHPDSVDPTSLEGQPVELDLGADDLAPPILRRAELPGAVRKKLPFQLDPIAVRATFDRDGCVVRVEVDSPPGQRLAAALAKAHARMVVLPRFGPDGAPAASRLDFPFGGHRYATGVPVGPPAARTVGEETAEGWLQRVNAAENALRGGDADGASTSATAVIREVSEQLFRGSPAIGRILGLAHFVRALAAAGGADAELAAWDLDLAIAHLPQLAQVDLAAYGESGARLSTAAAAVHQRASGAVDRSAAGVVIEDVLTILAHQLMSELPTSPRHECLDLEAPVAFVVDASGRAIAPESRSSETDPVWLERVLALVGAGTFAPPRCGGEPCAVAIEMPWKLRLGACPPRRRAS